MDPITIAIIAAATAGVAGGAGKVAEESVVDAYNALKELLKRKLGAESKVVKAVEEVEANPESKSRPATLLRELGRLCSDVILSVVS
jgi:isoaspartyl peptidase/L-asparaginase-like protein (Ntn-hydrolase superfamily)